MTNHFQEIIKKYRLSDLAWGASAIQETALQLKMSRLFNAASSPAKKDLDQLSHVDIYHLFLLREVALDDEIDFDGSTQKIKAIERLLIYLSTDERIPERLRRQFVPKPIAGSSGGAFLLKSCPCYFVTENRILDLQEGDLHPSSVYKPQHRALGGLDAKPLYMDQSTTLFYEIKPAAEMAELALLDPSWSLPHPIFLPKEYLDNPPEMIECSSGCFQRISRMRRSLAPDEGIYKELLFQKLIRSLEEKLPNELGVSLAFPKTSLEAIDYLPFGPHHKIGNRHAFIPHAKSLHDLYLQSNAGQNLRDFFCGIPFREICKISVPQILAVNLDATFGNFLLAGQTLWQVDATYTFPQFIGLSHSDTPIQSWALLSQGNSPYPAPWRDWILSLDAEEIVASLKAEESRQRSQNPEVKPCFTELSECVFRAALILLQEGARLFLTINQIASVQYPLPLYGKEGKKLLSANGAPVVRGGEFWPIIQLALIAQGYQPGKDPILFQEWTRSCRNYFQEILKRLAFLRHPDTFVGELLGSNDPLTLLLAVIDGKCDRLIRELRTPLAH